MSATDIEKGSRGLDEVGRALEGMKVGIICLTPENLAAAWILYEAGALAKTPDAKTRVCTYLLADLQPQNVEAPLGMFQWTRADKSDTLKLIHTINKHLDVSPVADTNLDTVFDKMWPDLEAKLSTLPEPTGVTPPSRSTGEMVAEILELTRTIVPEIQEINREAAMTRETREFNNSFWKSSADLSLNPNSFVVRGGYATPNVVIGMPASGAQLINVSEAMRGPSAPPGDRLSANSTNASPAGPAPQADGMYGLPSTPPSKKRVSPSRNPVSTPDIRARFGKKFSTVVTAVWIV